MDKYLDFYIKFLINNVADVSIDDAKVQSETIEKSVLTEVAKIDKSDKTSKI